MDMDYMLACGLMWRKTADPVAGQELIGALASGDPLLRQIAQAILVDSGEHSMDLLEMAITAGSVDPSFAGECMVQLLRNRTDLNGTVQDRRIN